MHFSAPMTPYHDLRSFVNDTGRRTVICPKDERYGYFGGSLLLLPSGPLIYSCGRIDFEREENHKVVLASEDRGRSWNEAAIIGRRPGVPKTMRGDSLGLIDNHRIAMIGNIDSSGFEIRFSSDGGSTWSRPVVAEGKGTVPWGNRAIQTPEGLLVTTRAPKLGETVRKAVMMSTSSDGGRAWEGPVEIAGDGVKKLTEPSTTRLQDGRLMTAIRETSYNFYPSYVTFSRDDGKSWSQIREMPIHGHEICLGQLNDGRAMVVYRHVGGYAATLAWAGSPDERPGYQVPATIRARVPPRITGDRLVIRTSGRGESVLYHLHPPESMESTIRIDAELRCLNNARNACGIHVAQAGWVAFYPDRVELPDCGGMEVQLDSSVYRSYTITRTGDYLSVYEGGRELLRTDRLNMGREVEVDYGTILPNNVNAFGTQTPFMADLECESAGESHWRSLRIEIDNPGNRRHLHCWEASSGFVPNQYEEDRMVMIEDNYGGSVYLLGQASWVQFPDGVILVSTGLQYLREDGKRSSWIRGCYLGEDDLPPKIFEK